MKARPLQADEVPPGMIVYLDKQSYKNGKTGYEIKSECPFCHKTRWVRVAFIRNGHTKTSRCRKCYLKYGNARELTQDEVPESKDYIIHLDRQKLFTEESTGKSQMRVLVECPDCHRQIWIRNNSIRKNKQKSTRCVSCAQIKRAPHPLKKPFSMSNGYKAIHLRTLPVEDADLARKYLFVHRGCYVYEHRMVALKKYGPDAFAPGIVVRHLDGNKINNHPDNIVIGTQRQNIGDHMTAFADVKTWRSIALTLFRVLAQLR